MVAVDASHEVVIEDDGHGHGHVFIDGMEIRAISYQVRGGVAEIQRVTVEFYARSTMSEGAGPSGE